MFRKLLLIAAATAMPPGLIVAAGGMVSAGAPMVNAADDVVSCQHVGGSAAFSPMVT